MWKKSINNLIVSITNALHWLLSPFVSEKVLLTWKPIHLCWWFEKNGLPIPKYFIAGGSTAPSVTTNAATTVKKDRATLNGDVTDDGGDTITARGFVYSSTDSTPTIGEGGVTDTGDLGGTTGTYSNTPTGLSANTLYYYQAYATNSKGTSYGGVQSFTTNTATSVALNTPADSATGVSVTPDLLFTGTDSDSLEIEYQVQVGLTSPMTDDSTGSLDTNVLASGNDARNIDGDSTYNDTVVTQHIGMFNTTDDYWNGFRWTSVTIPQGATILSATVDLYSAQVTSGTTVNSIWYGVDEDDVTAFADNTDNKPEGKTKTTASVSKNFTVSEWNATLGFGVDLVDVKTIVQEIVDRGGWSSGNSLAIVCHDNGSASTTYIGHSTYDRDTARGANLVVTYEVAGNYLFKKDSETPDATFAGTGDPHPWPSGNQVTYTVQAGNTLSNSTVHYWRARGKDPTGSDTFGAWATTRSFTTVAGGGGGATIKTKKGLALASVKTFKGLAIASVKTDKTLTTS